MDEVEPMLASLASILAPDDGTARLVRITEES
jgi:hypothetical protein